MDEEFKAKLQNYEEIKPECIKVGDHLRITSNKYKEEGKRKCTYIVVQDITTEGFIVCNGYGEKKYDDWIVKPHNRYKNYVFYKKKERVYTGICLDCEGHVDKPYFVCFTCHQNRRQALELPLETPRLVRT